MEYARRQNTSYSYIRLHSGYFTLLSRLCLNHAIERFHDLILRDRRIEHTLAMLTLKNIGIEFSISRYRSTVVEASKRNERAEVRIENAGARYCRDHSVKIIRGDRDTRDAMPQRFGQRPTIKVDHRRTKCRCQCMPNPIRLVPLHRGQDKVGMSQIPVPHFVAHLSNVHDTAVVDER